MPIRAPNITDPRDREVRNFKTSRECRLVLITVLPTRTEADAPEPSPHAAARGLQSGLGLRIHVSCLGPWVLRTILVAYIRGVLTPLRTT